MPSFPSIRARRRSILSIISFFFSWYSIKRPRRALVSALPLVFVVKAITTTAIITIKLRGMSVFSPTILCFSDIDHPYNNPICSLILSNSSFEISFSKAIASSLNLLTSSGILIFLSFSLITYQSVFFKYRSDN